MIFPEKTGWPGQWTLTIMSRGNDIIETVWFDGSVRISITVSERDGRVRGLVRAVVVADHERDRGMARRAAALPRNVCASFASFVCAWTAATDWWNHR